MKGVYFFFLLNLKKEEKNLDPFWFDKTFVGQGSLCLNKSVQTIREAILKHRENRKTLP